MQIGGIFDFCVHYTPHLTMNELPVQRWECLHVSQWLTVNGFSEYIDLLCTQHGLDGPALLTLTENDLRHPPQEIKVLGDRKRLMICIRKLQFVNRHVRCEIPIEKEPYPYRTGASGSIKYLPFKLNGKMDYFSENLDPEYSKVFLSCLFMFSSNVLTSISTMFVHDRLPDIRSYAPLPDLVLDRIPYIPWAFKMSEMTVILLILTWMAVLFFHKHRCILLRRTFFLTGCMYLLRCVTMLITSLPVPGTHLYPLCVPKEGDIYKKMSEALVVLKSFGMSVFGVVTCGDYIFSGHTACLTLLGLLINEYTPRHMYLLHITSWTLGLSGMFFILASHDHYTIDVFLAFYIMSRMFVFYHVVANSRRILQMNNRSTRIWFPLLTFFESKVDGTVPNEYEWPLPWPKCLKDMFI